MADAMSARSRWLDGAAALLALALAGAAVPAIRADLVYGAAVGYGGDPIADEPGRLEAYERAALLDTEEPLYALRAGDLHLVRAESRVAERSGHLSRALEHYRHAVRLAPLDPRARSRLAHALAASGEVGAARVQTGHSVLLGPCWAGVLMASMQFHLDAWERGGDPAELVDALRRVRSITGLGSSWGRAACALRLSTSTRDTQGDLLEALVRHPGLMREAAAVVATYDAGLAQLLRDVAGPETESDE